eukprot:7616046-Heterocapsa_arctica.AAC.1
MASHELEFCTSGWGRAARRNSWGHGVHRGAEPHEEPGRGARGSHEHGFVGRSVAQSTRRIGQGQAHRDPGALDADC